MNKDKIALLYGYENEEKLSEIISVFKEVHTRTKVLKNADCNEKLGFILGLNGFKKNDKIDEDFIDDEIMIFQNIQGKNLDNLLEKFKERDIKITKNKAIATPFNVHWTIKKIYEKMQNHQNTK